MKNLTQVLVSKLGRFTSRKGGQELSFKCPICNDWKHRLDINIFKKVYHCFNCGDGGKIRDLLKLKDCFYDDSVSKVKEIKPDLILNRDQIPDFKFTFPILDLFNKKILRCDKQFNIKLADQFGFRAYEGGRYKNRLLIPVIENRQLMCYLIRSVNGEKPKEISPKAEITNRSHFLWPYDHSKAFMPLILVEGVFDALHLIDLGYNALALMGSFLSDIQIGKILAKMPAKVYIMMDGDEAGKKATVKIAQALRRRMNPFKVETVYLLYGKDPDELTAMEIEELLK